MRRSRKVGLGFWLLAIMTVLIAVPVPASAAIAADVAVLVNGETVIFDVPPAIRDGRTFLPLRRVAEMLGAEVGYDAAEQRVTVVHGDLMAQLWIGRLTADVNGESAIIDVAPFVVEGRTMVPVRFLAETLSFLVDWDEVTRTVHLTDPEAVPPTRVVVETPVTQVRVGEFFPVHVHLQRARAAYTAVVNLEFGPELQAFATHPGTIIEGLLAVNSIDNDRTRIDYAVSRVGPVRGFSGDGVVYSVTFRAMSAGEARIVPLIDTMVIDSGLQPLDLVLNGVTITVVD